CSSGPDSSSRAARRSGDHAGSSRSRCAMSPAGWTGTTNSWGRAMTALTNPSASYRTNGRSSTMAVRQLGNDTTTAYVDGADLVMERVFDAPRELVWKALTEPERIPHWWGPRKTTM